jgi:predicted phosphoribosyltransferase
MKLVAFADEHEPFFANRFEAAKLLAKRLEGYGGRNPLVLVSPRGPVLMAQVTAESLGGDLDVVRAHKRGAPYEEEFAIGSVCKRGDLYLSEKAELYGVEKSYVDREVSRHLDVLRRRRAASTPLRPPISPAGRVVILVDNGIATGWTMIAALRSIRPQNPKRLIAAMAVASRTAVDRMRQEAAEVVYPGTPAAFYALGQFFADFAQVKDEEVVETQACTPASKGSERVGAR